MVFDVLDKLLNKTFFNAICFIVVDFSKLVLKRAKG